MRFISKNAAIVACCFIFALVFVAPAVIHSDEWNLTTRFTINHAFEVPGMVLQPNTRYVIRLYDSPAERHVVQIFNGEQTKLLTTFMAVSDQRAEPADNTVFTFIETAPGYPVPMKEWFYPGRITGLEFIYPKQQAKEIAQHAIEPVLSASTSDLHDLASVEVEAIQPLGKETPVVATSAANITKVENAPAAVEEKPSITEETAPTVQDNENKSTSTVEEQQQNQTESQSTVTNETEAQQEKPAETSVTTAQSQNQQPTELPRTAGELPLVVLLGMLCLGAGLGMRVLSSKS